MKKHFVWKFLLLVVIALLIGGCFDKPLFRPSRITAPTPPDSIDIEVCDTVVVNRYTEASRQMSVDTKRVVFREMVTIDCGTPIVSDTMTVVNDAGNDAAFVHYLETMPGAQYRRYYFRDALGDTLFRPAPTGTTTFISWLDPFTPSGAYLDVGYYRGTIRMPQYSARVAGPLSVQWHITNAGVLAVGCKSCRTVRVPK